MNELAKTIIAIITLNTLLLVTSVKNKKNERCYFTNTPSYSNTLPFFV
jgi:hypothetical protein